MTPLSRLAAIAREDGWPLTLQRAFLTALLRLRNRAIGAKLSAPNFHCGRHPRLLGLAHMRIGRNFHAGDALWLHAIAAYEGRAYTPELLIGDGVAILPGASIGDGAIIGANSVVTGTIPPQTIAHGAPARPTRQWNPTTAQWQPIPPS